MLYLTSVVMGLVIGSFLNVVINRLKLGKAFVSDRSYCPHCKHTLGALDLVPVISYLVLGGKCRYCGKKISTQYPIVEAVTSVVFLLAAVKIQTLNLELVFYWVLFSFFIIIAVYDLKHFLILDKVVFPGLAVAILFALYNSFNTTCATIWCSAIVSGLIGALLVSGFFYFQHLISQGRWIGFGDVKLGLMLGMSTGFPYSLLLLFLAYVSGAFVGVGLMAAGQKQLGSKLPFGTFLSFSAVVTMLYGQPVINWYLSLIGLSL